MAGRANEDLSYIQITDTYAVRQLQSQPNCLGMISL